MYTPKKFLDPYRAMHEDVSFSLVCVGKELEDSWLPIIEGARRYHVSNVTMQR
jgi:hypothetical protein